MKSSVKTAFSLALKTFVGDGTKSAGCIKLLLATTHCSLFVVYLAILAAPAATERQVVENKVGTLVK
jgi:hypothetical protein